MVDYEYMKIKCCDEKENSNIQFAKKFGWEFIDSQDIHLEKEVIDGATSFTFSNGITSTFVDTHIEKTKYTILKFRRDKNIPMYSELNEKWIEYNKLQKNPIKPKREKIGGIFVIIIGVIAIVFGIIMLILNEKQIPLLVSGMVSLLLGIIAFIFGVVLAKKDGEYNKNAKAKFKLLESVYYKRLLSIIEEAEEICMKNNIYEYISNAGKNVNVTLASPIQKDPIDKIKELKILKDQGIITEKEFEEKKKELLAKI